MRTVPLTILVSTPFSGGKGAFSIVCLIALRDNVRVHMGGGVYKYDADFPIYFN